MLMRNREFKRICGLEGVIQFQRDSGRKGAVQRFLGRSTEPSTNVLTLHAHRNCAKPHTTVHLTLRSRAAKHTAVLWVVCVAPFCIVVHYQILTSAACCVVMNPVWERILCSARLRVGLAWASHCAALTSARGTPSLAPNPGSDRTQPFLFYAFLASGPDVEK